MVCAVGIDAVDIIRFADWHTYCDARLKRIFSDEEVVYCKAIPVKSAERFAARFAAKEAFYKALCSLYPEKKISLFTIMSQVSVVANMNGSVRFKIEGDVVGEMVNAHLSITHTDTVATAIVIFSSTPLSDTCSKQTFPHDVSR
jgi:holo-[acyl-carrier protein] synthase